MNCEKKVKAVLYEVSLFLAENSHDYEARELQKKVISVMDDRDFNEGKAEHETAGANHAVALVNS